jgi:CTP:molybdopterin cytidylyltransferase MocA
MSGLAAVILAAGESRRMSTAKALLPYRGRTFLEHLRDVSQHRRVRVTRIVLGAQAEEIQKKLSLDPATVVLNPEWQKGQLSSIQAAVRSLPPAYGAVPGLPARRRRASAGKPPEWVDGMLLLLVDHPLITAALVALLVEKFYESRRLIVVPAYRGRRGHPVIFSSRLFPELLAASPDVGARAVVWAHAADLVEVPTEEEGVVLNLNDPETLRRALGPK